MAKEKTAFFCSECGAESPKWAGRCPECGAWNTMTEQRVSTGKAPGGSASALWGGDASTKSAPLTVNQINVDEESAAMRIKMPSVELNRVLGGGLVAGSLVLLGGEPGIGKSTLLLQNLLCIRTKRILYVSGEESAAQLKLRADRLGRGSDNIYIVCETSLETVFEHVSSLRPEILVVDSIQTITTDSLPSSPPPGSVSQVRACAAELLRYAKTAGVPVMLVGHITKDGTLAGPKVLEHMVDTVLVFEGDARHSYRILRTSKNRFGPTSELGIYEMGAKGLREVPNPSEILITSPAGDANGTPLSGIAIGVALQGRRPILIEAQALVSASPYATPQRSVTGFDSKRLNMLIAVIEKRLGLRLDKKDVFLNIAGGFKANDPALDLAVAAALISATLDAPVPQGFCFACEVGLSGEIRPVTSPASRIREARRLGFTDAVVADNIPKDEVIPYGIRLHRTARLDAAMKLLFA